MNLRSATSLSLAAAACAVVLIGCVPASQYNNMVQQRNALEASLRSEISADQVKIEQLENGIRVRMSDGLLYRSGSTDLHPSGKAALDKASGEMSKMAAQGFQIDVTGNTDTVPMGPSSPAAIPPTGSWPVRAPRSSSATSRRRA